VVNPARGVGRSTRSARLAAGLPWRTDVSPGIQVVGIVSQNRYRRTSHAARASAARTTRKKPSSWRSAPQRASQGVGLMAVAVSRRPMAGLNAGHRRVHAGAPAAFVDDSGQSRCLPPFLCSLPVSRLNGFASHGDLGVRVRRRGIPGTLVGGHGGPVASSDRRPLPDHCENSGRQRPAPPPAAGGTSIVVAQQSRKCATESRPGTDRSAPSLLRAG